MATTRAPLTAIWLSWAFAGPGRTMVRHVVPSEVVQAAGRPLCEPTETKPSARAATARVWLEPVASLTSWARVQLVRFAEYQTSAAQPPGTASLPRMTYPRGPAAAETVEILPRPAAMFPAAVRQVVPFAEVRTTGPGTPTASHPAGPWATVISVAGACRAGRSSGEVTRVQDPPGRCRQIAG